jgi:hypothetical protein
MRRFGLTLECISCAKIMSSGPCNMSSSSSRMVYSSLANVSQLDYTFVFVRAWMHDVRIRDIGDWRSDNL